jgi:hypothetical protein
MLDEKVRGADSGKESGLVEIWSRLTPAPGCMSGYVCCCNAV